MRNIVPPKALAAPQTVPATAFLVGQDKEGHWLVVETHGKGGGLFRSQTDALHYATFETGHRPGAVRLAHQILDLKL